MSLHREVVIWKSGGQYHAGMYAWFQTGEDYEWDVEYDFGSFVKVYSGSSENAAYAALTVENANPGGYHLEDRMPRIAELNKMAKEVRK